jgi:hypothetical protein
MDDVARLIDAFRDRATPSLASRLNVLIELDLLSDPRIVPFLLHVLADQHEPTQVRVHILKQLRNGRLTPAHRSAVAEALLEILSERSNPVLRLESAWALAEFTDIDGVPAGLGGPALDRDESIDLRYSAFTSLQRAGPTTECVTLLRQLLGDEMLGQSARSALLSWHLE